MTNQHLNTAAIMAFAANGIEGSFDGEGRQATPQQREAKFKARLDGAEERIRKAKEKQERKKKRNKLLVKLRGFHV